MRFLALVTDAFGGRGGIAQFNRHFLTAIASHPASAGLLVLPRVIDEAVPAIPQGLTYDVAAAGSRVRYLGRLFSAMISNQYDAVVCAHIHLLPLAAMAARLRAVPLILVIYGIESWKPPGRRLARRLVRSVDVVISISQFTSDRFLAWSGVARDRVRLLPCCIDLEAFGPGLKRDDLLDRHGLRGLKVLLTVARLAGAERYKGFDEVMEALPALAAHVPSIRYLIVGEGPDRSRLEYKAAQLGVADRVVFAGYIPETEKADYYRLADAFVMPGRGEGFGIVYLEAMACGVPIVASSKDASREVVAGAGVGEVVNPDDADGVVTGILRALGSVRRVPASHLRSFSISAFRDRCHSIVDEIVSAAASHVATHRASVPP